MSMGEDYSQRNILMGLVVAKCSKSGEKFAMRFKERSPGLWITDWCFKVGELSSLNNESVENNSTLHSMSGRFELDPEYPGCPYCESKSFFMCHCGVGKYGCWDNMSSQVTCPHCKATAHLTGKIESLVSKSDG